MTTTARTAAPAAARRSRTRHRGPLAVLVLPFTLFFVAFFVAPIVYAVVQSLFAVRSSGLGLGPPTRSFVGLGNYLQVLSSGDFVASLGRVLVFSAIEVPLMVGVSLTLALLLESGRARWPRLFRAVFFLPYGVPGVVASLLWGFLYVPSTSPILQGLDRLGLTVTPLASGSVLLSIANIALWSFAGYNMLILVASLQSISGDLYEAARLDGAGDLAIIRHITLPLLRPTVVLVTVFTIIGTLQLFVEPLVLRPLTSAISSTFTPNLAAYNAAFAGNDSNTAAAMAVVLALVAFVFSFGFLRLVNRKGNRAW
ncbi:carbohydrate ABC transporter permease [Cellulomonas endophytica]|uniref:carbohydrate ABC transporter permease n=1 Tax=Cellulomonas endophytica TaxID=2494735 RepID=UPI00101386FA|nr:sugar ABC transporter permease [Cellulomonas endophytica]